MEIRIGILNTPREINIESPLTNEEATKLVAKSLTDGENLLQLTDDKGSVFVVPTANISYVEIGGDTTRQIGFVA